MLKVPYDLCVEKEWTIRMTALCKMEVICDSAIMFACLSTSYKTILARIGHIVWLLAQLPL